MDEEKLTVETDEYEQSADIDPTETVDDDKSEKSVSADLIRGHINTIILRSLYDGDKYGYEIIAEIERKSSGQYSLKQPSLYSALKRLEKDGYITSYWGGSVGGGRRKYFSLTDEGKAISEQNQAEWEYSRTIIDSLISDRDFDFNLPAPTAVDMRVLKRSTSRVPSHEDGEEDEDFSFEPGIDDDALRQQLETAYSEKHKALEEEYAEKLAALDRDRADFEAEKARLEEELAAREREIRDTYEANLKELDLIRMQQEAALQIQKEQFEREFAEERAKFEAEKEQNRAESEADNALKEELETLKQRSAEEEEAHERALSALREENAALKAEQENAVRLAREEEAALRENQYQAERTRYSELLNEERNRYNTALAEENARHEAQIRDDRARYQQALDDQLAALRSQMELEMAMREKEIIHRNYISLVDSPSPRSDAQPAAAGEQKREEDDYRNVVGRLYENTVRPAAKPVEVSATPASGIDFRDIQKRAERDGLRVETVGGEVAPVPEKTADDTNTVHKGKAMFLSSIFVFFWCVIIGGIAMGLRGTLSIPLFYPYLMWCFGLVLLLTTGLMYANHFGENRLRKPTLSLINAIVVYALIVIVALIVALSARIDFSDASDLMNFVFFPAIYFIAVLIFGVCYFLQVRPKK